MRRPTVHEARAARWAEQRRIAMASGPTLEELLVVEEKRRRNIQCEIRIENEQRVVEAPPRRKPGYCWEVDGHMRLLHAVFYGRERWAWEHR